MAEESQKRDFYRKTLEETRSELRKLNDCNENSRVFAEKCSFSQKNSQISAENRCLLFENQVLKRQLCEIRDFQEPFAENAAFSQEIEEFSKDLLSFSQENAVLEAKRAKVRGFI